MNINIQINDKEVTSVTTSSTPGADDSQNSGPCKASTGVTSGPGADMLDIGAPPAWLAETMQKESASPARAVQDQDQEPAPVQDNDNGGSAPSF